MRLVFDNLSAKRFGKHRATIFVDVFSVGLISEDDGFGAEFAQDARRGFVSRAVAAIHNNSNSLQRHAARKTRFGEFNVTPQRIVNAHGLADFRSEEHTSELQSLR